MLIGQNVKNKFINSKFEIWQRATSTSLSNNVYTADRWYYESTADGGTGATVNASRQSIFVGSAFEEQNYFARLTVSTIGTFGSNAYASFMQKIEDVRTFAGKKVMVSFWMSSTIPNKQVAFWAAQIFGSGGSSTVLVPAQVVTLTSSVVRYNIVFDVPSIVGKTLGVGNSLNVGIFPMVQSGVATGYGISPIAWQATGDIDIVRAMICEIGSASEIPTFETAGKNFSEEIQLCQRYYEKSYDIDTAVGSNTNNGIVNGSTGEGSRNVSSQIVFKVMKRAVPIMSYFDQVGNSNRVSFVNAGSAAQTDNINAIVTQHAGHHSAQWFGSTSAGGTFGFFRCHWTANAEL